MIIKSLYESLVKTYKKSHINESDEEKLQEIVKELPKGIQSYQEALDYVKSENESMFDICVQIADILETSHYEIYKTFHKLKKGKFMVYFNKVYTDDNMRIYQHGKRNIQIDTAVFKPSAFKKLQHVTLVIPFGFDQMLSKELRHHDDISLTDDVSLTYDEVYELLQIILARFQFILQAEITDPIEPKNIEKRYKNQIGYEYNTPSLYSFTPDKKETLINRIRKHCKTPRELMDFIYNLLWYENGNEYPSDVNGNDPEAHKRKCQFKLDKPLFTFNNGNTKVYGIKCKDKFGELAFFYKDERYIDWIDTSYYPLRHWRSVNKISITRNFKDTIPITQQNKLDLLETCAAYICYFSNNVNL